MDKEKEKSPGTVVIVWWTDSAMHPSDVCRADDPTLGPMSGISAGMLVKDDDEGVTLALDLWDTGDFRTLQSIYRGQIHHVEKIEL